LWETAKHSDFAIMVVLSQLTGDHNAVCKLGWGRWKEVLVKLNAGHFAFVVNLRHHFLVVQHDAIHDAPCHHEGVYKSISVWVFWI
jgi:hypothetical protein